VCVCVCVSVCVCVCVCVCCVLLNEGKKKGVWIFCLGVKSLCKETVVR